MRHEILIAFEEQKSMIDALTTVINFLFFFIILTFSLSYWSHVMFDYSFWLAFGNTFLLTSGLIKSHDVHRLLFMICLSFCNLWMVYLYINKGNNKFMAHNMSITHMLFFLVVNIQNSFYLFLLITTLRICWVHKKKINLWKEKWMNWKIIVNYNLLQSRFVYKTFTLVLFYKNSFYKNHKT